VNVPGPPHEGLLLYTPDGYVSANLLPKGREWTIETATLEDPEKMKRFRPFVNSDESDPSIVNIRLRDQHRPATWEEKKRNHG